MKILTLHILGLIIVTALFPVAQAQVPDPGVTGPLAVTTEEYDFGDLAFTPVGAPSAVELRAVVHHPSDMTGGPFPLIMFVHGIHDLCYKKKGQAGANQTSKVAPTQTWPCAAGLTPIPNYRGYDYVGEVLASNGFIVVSISMNGTNALGQGPEATSRQQVIQKHLDIWKQFNSTGGEPFGAAFVGKVDMTRIGTVGHSAGGQGVVGHYAFNLQQPSPYQIRAVLAIAPADDLGLTINNVPFGVLLSYCDGDRGLAGIHYFDRSRYNVPGDPAPKHAIMVMGANHNFYNTTWTPSIFPASSVDDGAFCDSDQRTGRLTDGQQRSVAIAYISAFCRVYLKGELQFLPLLTGAAPPPPSASFAQVFISYLPADDSVQRMDVNRLLDQSSLTENTAGGPASQSGLDTFSLCGGAGEPSTCLATSTSVIEPHAAAPGLSQLRLGWSDTSAVYVNNLPDGLHDISRFAALQFRAAVDFEETRNKKRKPQDFTVEMVDGAGRASDVRVSAVSSALYFPPGGSPRLSADLLLPRLYLSDVRIPLTAFTNISLQDVRSIRFKFDQKPHGSILISDIAFVSP